MVSATVVVGGGAYTCSSVAVHVPGHRLLFRNSGAGFGSGSTQRGSGVSVL